VGLRAEKVEDLDRVIAEMLAVDKPVIADICVDQKENVFPMIPSGAPHNEMLLGPEHNNAGTTGVTDAGLALV
jgi:acetolactate synthase-1/2/3 large subunit